jgi:hypothetical protein
MKKKTTIVDQPDKTEAIKPELLMNLPRNQKMYRDHSHHDHLHGRVNKFPFGSSHGPLFF